MPRYEKEEGSPRDYTAGIDCWKQPTQKSRLGEPLNAIHYIGLDVHKKTITYCIKTACGQIVKEGTLVAERTVLRNWAGGLQQPWHGAMEATIFSAWIYDTLKPYADRLEMGHPAKMKAITAGKKKSDAIDARTIADLVRCDLLPGCYVFPPDLRDLRRLMRYRQMMVQQSVRMHNKTAGLLMESGVSFHKTKLHGKKYFSNLIKSLEEVPESVKDLLRMSRGTKDMFEGVQKQLLGRLLTDAALKQRVERLSSIDGVGEITALSWALEIGDPHRFASIADAVSYCGLTAALHSSAGKQQRGPISKQRNAWLQTALIEAAKLAPRWNPQLAQLHAQQLTRGHANRATLQVARKLVAYLLAVRQERAAFPGAYTAAKNHPNKEKSQKTSCLGGLVAGRCLFWVCSVSDPPAGPHVFGDCARELTLPIHPTVCFEAGWFTLTQSS